MHQPTLLFGGALLSLALSGAALAQEPGAGTPKPQPYHKPTAEEKAAGKAQRREEGRAAVKEGGNSGEITPLPPAQAKPSPADSQQARAERKAETRRAAKAGELKASGEVGPK
ncbi:hypothetical protein [Pseudorhodoferax sp.]|uniref:hypothetical protein n=1 Tax=Pseudorhodoferax sp. TaxID=1993553 RepID=UPI002DD672AB|nr:hypothetical protein [Pseudorhodoferax sp.]